MHEIEEEPETFMKPETKRIPTPGEGNGYLSTTSTHFGKKAQTKTMSRGDPTMETGI